MNLFIGLLNLAINDYNKYEEFLLQKAKVNFTLIIIFINFINVKFIGVFYIDNFNQTLFYSKKIIMEIELFYMLPYQKRNIRKQFSELM